MEVEIRRRETTGQGGWAGGGRKVETSGQAGRGEGQGNVLRQGGSRDCSARRSLGSRQEGPGSGVLVSVGCCVMVVHRQGSREDAVSAQRQAVIRLLVYTQAREDQPARYTNPSPLHALLL